MFFIIVSDSLFLQAFRDQGIEHVVSKLTGLDHPATVQELASKVLNRIQGESETSTASSSD